MLRYVLLGAFVALGALTGPAWACSCPPHQSAAQQAEENDFVALVTAGERTEVGKTDWGGPASYLTQFEVHEVFKGPDLDDITVMSSPAGMPACGIGWLEGAETILLATDRGDGRYTAWMCSVPQFSEADFRVALMPGTVAEAHASTPALTSPQSGDVIAGVLKIQGNLPGHWFFENAAHGELLFEGEVIDEFPVSPISSQNWTEPGDKTVDLEVSLTPPTDMALELRISQSMYEDGAVPEAITIPFSVLAPTADAREQDRAALIHAKTVIWLGHYLRGDADGLAGFLHEDFVLIGADGSVMTRDEEVAHLRQRGWAAPADFAYTVDDVIFLTDATALVYGHATSTRTNAEGQACTHRYTSSNTFRRFDGAWTPVSSHVSGVSCKAE